MHKNENLKTGHLAWQLPPDYDVELSVILVLCCKCVSKNKQKNEIETWMGWASTLDWRAPQFFDFREQILYKTISMAKFHDNPHMIHKFIKSLGQLAFIELFKLAIWYWWRIVDIVWLTQTTDQRSKKETMFGHLIPEYRPLSHNEDIIFLTTKTPILQGFVFLCKLAP